MKTNQWVGGVPRGSPHLLQWNCGTMGTGSERPAGQPQSDTGVCNAATHTLQILIAHKCHSCVTMAAAAALLAAAPGMVCSLLFYDGSAKLAAAIWNSGDITWYVYGRSLVIIIKKNVWLYIKSKMTDTSVCFFTQRSYFSLPKVLISLFSVSLLNTNTFRSF